MSNNIFAPFFPEGRGFLKVKAEKDKCVIKQFSSETLYRR